MTVIVILLFFGVVSLLTPLVQRRLGRGVFPLIALLPAAAFGWTVAQSGTVLAGDQVRETVTWIPQLGWELSFRLDHLAWLLALVVTGVGALVLLYCVRYFAKTAHDMGRFAGILLAFTGVMFGLVTSDDVLLLVTFWEATSVLSYLLIGHNTAKKESRGAALQAMLVTTLGGLAMLVGVLILAGMAGSTSLSNIIEAAPTGPLAITAIMLVILGAVSKSALVPLHFWLPAAMAAPTPVSAYLHAAAMVKAGIYLIARLATGFAELPGWQPVLIILGGLTMLIGGLRALRQFDLKLVLAYGTVSQLGFMALVLGFGGHDAALAGITLLLAHALFKATLFLVVGIIDHEAGTRDWRQLSGIGRRRPVLFLIAVVAVASMAGVPPLLGFVAKEAVLSAFLAAGQSGAFWGWVAFVVTVIGSILTAAYSARFLWGAFGRRAETEDSMLHRSPPDILIAPGFLALASLGLGIFASWLDGILAPYPDTFAAGGHYHLALWHGASLPLLVSAGILAVGGVMFWQRLRISRAQAALPHGLAAAHGYWAIISATDRFALRLISRIQSGGLPGYLASIFVVFVLALTVTAPLGRIWPETMVLWEYPAQAILAVMMIAAAIGAACAGERITAVLMIGVNGYGMVALFAFQGAPDLALTQVLVETVTIVVFVLVLRRLPLRIAQHNKPVGRKRRAVLGILVGGVMAAIGAIALGARQAPSIAAELPELAVTEGHGHNVVNVMLVDIRAWDTMGEISVLVAVATGVASLLFVSGRTGRAPRLEGSRERRHRSNFLRPVREDVSESGSVSKLQFGAAPIRLGPHEESQQDAGSATPGGQGEAARTRTSWLLAGRTLSAKNRSILVEVLVRLLFHPAIIVSVFLLFTGHNAPGGGFAGSLLAGLALVARYLAGGRYELGEAAPIDAGKLLGVGVLLAVGVGVTALLFGQQILESSWWQAELPVLGTISVGTSTLFDIGVYLVVIGLVLDVLRSLGGEIDRHEEELGGMATAAMSATDEDPDLAPTAGADKDAMPASTEQEGQR